MLTVRVVARFQRRVADQAPGGRKETRDSVRLVNKPKGISREVVRDFAQTDTTREDGTKPDRRDLRPKDLFQPVPRSVGVLNYVEKGWPGDSNTYVDMDRTLRVQVPRDKGYATVNNLSQYLIETGGGGGTSPVGGV